MVGVVSTPLETVLGGLPLLRRARRTGMEAAIIVTAASAIPRMLRGTVWTGSVSDARLEARISGLTQIVIAYGREGSGLGDGRETSTIKGC